MGERGKEQETDGQSVSLLAHQCVCFDRITRAGGSRLGEMGGGAEHLGLEWGRRKAAELLNGRSIARFVNE